MEIRAAQNNDIRECVELNNQSILDSPSNSSSGFLVTKLTIEMLAEFDRDGILRVAREQDRVIGFVLGFTRDSNFFRNLLPLMPQVKWNDASIASIPTLIYLYKKVVDLGWRRRGVASRLYESLFKEFPMYSYIGATVEKPVINQPSQMFREKLGFIRVGTFSAPEFEGLKNYQSGIYFKRAYNH